VSENLSRSVFSGLNRRSVEHAVRTTVAASASLAIARLLGLPEAEWAAISTMVVTQSTLGAALSISGERFAGTALGAFAGGLLAAYLHSGALAFIVGLFALGLVCPLLRLDRAAYRFAGITLAIVVLVARSRPAAIVAAHRFFEVSLGIATGLAFTAIWPERERAQVAEESKGRGA
jgi:uncharacterized membrane protein YccC